MFTKHYNLNNNKLGSIKFDWQLGAPLVNLISSSVLFLSKSLPVEVKAKSSNTKNVPDALRDLVSVIVWHFHGCSNACECMLMLFFVT